MVSNVRNLLCLTILALSASTDFAIHCYQCNSMLLNNCGQAEESDLIDCSNVSPPRQLRQHFKVGSATGCMQQTVEIQPSFQVTERSCYFGNVSNKEGCQMFTTLDEAKILTCDICTKDGCNGSASLAPFAGVIILFLGVARWLV